MVCLGNICRSPMAEGILRNKAFDKGIKIEIDSAGTGDYHVGEHPDKRAVETMAKFGIDISDLRARQFTVSDFDEFDEIYAMDDSNYKNILSLSRNALDESKVTMILNLTNEGENRSVPDPYFGGMDGFDKVYYMLDDACEVILENK